MEVKKSAPTSIRLSEDMRQIIEIIARIEFRPFSKQVEYFLSQAIDRYVEHDPTVLEEFEALKKSK